MYTKEANRLMLIVILACFGGALSCCLDPVPQPPINLQLLLRNTTSIAIGWDAPDFDIPVKFNIYYGITPSMNYNKSVTAPGKIFKAHGLKEGTEYRFQLTSCSADGESQFSDPLFISTLKSC
ncbi:uncharacterized protein LOC134687693 [Mytilus trossulus]|uniref:uncharacterized protein LOC134687693 n=1 Tax=Mytilus trossulus TaxID=6551 RepID=UPI003005B864